MKSTSAVQIVEQIRNRVKELNTILQSAHALGLVIDLELTPHYDIKGGKLHTILIRSCTISLDRLEDSE